MAPTKDKIKVELADIPANECIVRVNGGRRILYINIKKYVDYWVAKFEGLRGATLDIKCKRRYYYSGGVRGIAFDFCELNTEE